MTLFEEIKLDHRTSRKSGDKLLASVLGFIIGELTLEEKRGKTINDHFVITILKKLVKANIETDNAQENLQFVKYIPSELSEMELEQEVDNIMSTMDASDISMKSMGFIMKELKAKFPGLIDGKTASNIIRKMVV
jgi:uncharacterized protein YqeY